MTPHCVATWHSYNCKAKPFLLYLLVEKCPEHGEWDVKEQHLQHHLSLSNQPFLQWRRMIKKKGISEKPQTVPLLFTAQQQVETWDLSCSVYPHPELWMLWVLLLTSVKKHKVCFWVWGGLLVKGDTDSRKASCHAHTATAAEGLAPHCSVFPVGFSSTA